MEKNKCGNRYSPEVRERAVRMVFEHQGEFDSQFAAIKSIAPKIRCGPDTLRAWVRRAETTAVDVTTAEPDRIKALERENRQLRQANEILKKVSVGSIGQRNGSFEGISRRLEAKRFSGLRRQPNLAVTLARIHPTGRTSLMRIRPSKTREPM